MKASKTDFRQFISEGWVLWTLNCLLIVGTLISTWRIVDEIRTAGWTSHALTQRALELIFIVVTILIFALVWAQLL